MGLFEFFRSMKSESFGPSSFLNAEDLQVASTESVAVRFVVGPVLDHPLAVSQGPPQCHHLIKVEL
eukprot:scaffold871_cov130-Cylindrotheca_fusiformis.AAC.9